MASFSIPLSGLDANQEDLSIISNDLANLNTVGYKSSDAQFSDLFYEQLSSAGNGQEIQLGGGTQLSSDSANFTEGSLSTTGINTNAAIEGDGFFVVQNGSTVQYSRAGDFSLNAQDQLVAADGSLVQGYPATNGVVNTSAAIGDITIPKGQTLAPAASTNFQMDLNLNSQTASGGTFSTGITVYDSQGGAHVITATFTKQNASNTWGYAFTIPGADVGSSSATVSLGPGGNLVFGANGQLTSPSGAITIPAFPSSPNAFVDGAGQLNLTWNTSSNGQSLVTQSSTGSSAANVQADGYAPGTLTDFNIGADGTISGTFSNGQTRAIGQLAIAQFANDDGLVRTGNGNFETSLDSGAASIGVANTGGRGTIQGGAVETSNVDISTEFSDLIVAQRGYEANAKALTTFDQIAMDTINIIQ